MNWLTNIIIILLFFNTCFVAAQTQVSGRLFDASQNSIPWANVVLLDSVNQNVLTGTTSDTLGYFSLDYPQSGNFLLRISSVGFEEYNRTIHLSVELGDVVLTASHSLDEIVLTSKGIIRLEKKKGVFVAHVENTTFNNSANVWDGLKQVPMLQANDKGLKVNNKSALLEINDMQLQMTGEELQNYLESLGPNAVKNIEINSNPNASYGSEVDAVVTIILKNQINNYRMALKTSNGYRSNYYSNENINFSLGRKKLKIYTNYSFKYLPTINTSEIRQRIRDQESLLDYTENDALKSHHLSFNLAYDLSKKDRIHFNHIFSSADQIINGESIGADFRRIIDIDSDTKTTQFTQEWKHSFNDSTFLKLGFYEVLKNAQTYNKASVNDLNEEHQDVNSRIPLFIGFLDYASSSELGELSMGLKYNSNKVRNDNISSINNQTISSPFEYDEQLISLYVNKAIYFTDTRSLDLGIRSESTFVNYTFGNSSLNEVLSNKSKYTNTLFNVNYNWMSNNEWYKNLSFRKQITRPNYSYLNPFKTIESDVVLFKGDLDIVPEKHYSLSHEWYKDSWSLYTQIGLYNDFISSINELDDTLITQTYKNFDQVYYTGFGLDYSHAFFDGRWRTRNAISMAYFKIEDASYEALKRSTPAFNFQSYQNINLAKQLDLSLNYSLDPAFNDGLMTYFATQKLDIYVSKKMNDFKLIFFIKDVFKTSYSSDEISTSDFLYRSNYYSDVHSVGITLRWSIKGKAYEPVDLETPEDAAINRLENR